MLQGKVSGDVTQHWWYIQYNTGRKHNFKYILLNLSIHDIQIFWWRIFITKTQKMMIAGRYFIPIRMANHPLHSFSLSWACYHYFHSLLTGPVDAPPPNHWFTKTVYIYPNNKRISAITWTILQELGISSEHHLIGYWSELLSVFIDFHW